MTITATSAHAGTSIDRAALRVVFLSSLGGALEFYDFIVFGVFGASISRAFFPAGDPLVSQIQALSVFALGYLARPLGGLLFGRRGDQVGRRHSFLLSLATMSAATVGMGLMPSYAAGGVACTILFILLRLVQGFCLGGELPGAITYAVEVVPVRRASLACGLVFGCVSSGVLIATGVSQFLHATLSDAQMESFGWRIAFLVGGALGVLSWMMRRSLQESPAFLRMRAHLDRVGADARGPLAELFLEHRTRLLVGIAATGIVATFNGLLFAHMGAYLIRTLAYAPPAVASALNIASAAMALALIAGTWVADIVPRRHVFAIGCVVLALAALPAYTVMVEHGMPLGPLFLIIGLSAGCTHGTFAAILADLFPTQVRFSGVAFSMNIGAVIFSALGALLATWAVRESGWLAAPGVLTVIAAVVALVALRWLPGLEGQIGQDRKEFFFEQKNQETLLT